MIACVPWKIICVCQYYSNVGVILFQFFDHKKQDLAQKKSRSGQSFHFLWHFRPSVVSPTLPGQINLAGQTLFHTWFLAECQDHWLPDCFSFCCTHAEWNLGQISACIIQHTIYRWSVGRHNDPGKERGHLGKRVIVMELRRRRGSIWNC